jgi:hypothetical protein
VAAPSLCTLLSALLFVCGLTAALGADPALAGSSTPYFTALSNSLGVQRGDAVSATLPDGRVLIAGGQNEGGFISDAELFNPTGDTFAKLEGAGREPAEARQGAAAAALPDGRILILGGSNSSGDLSTAELFDPAGDTFTKLEGAGGEMTVAREHPLAVAMPDGQVLIAGGSTEVLEFGFIRREEVVSSAELFDPTSDTFTKLEGPGRETAEPRWGPAAAALPDGQVLIAGGRYQGSAELFDPASDIFTKLEGAGRSMVEARQGATATPLSDGQVLIAGGLSGVTNLTSAELFDPADDTFTKLEGAGSNLTEAREFAVADALPDGRVLIAGGVNAQGWLSGADVYLTAPRASVVGGAFGNQTVGESRASSVVVTNLGAQRLSISAASIEGTDGADWTIAGDGCSGRTLSFAQSCVVSLLFTPSREGSLEATLKLVDNEPSRASTTSITGSGVPRTQGPQGSAGATGSPGAAGARGPRGPAGQVELILCAAAKARNGVLTQHCEVKLSSSPFKFTGSGRKLAASLHRGGRRYATGFALLASHGKTQLLLRSLRGLAGGRYTLVIENKHKQRRETITIGRSALLAIGDPPTRE